MQQQIILNSHIERLPHEDYTNEIKAAHARSTFQRMFVPTCDNKHLISQPVSYRTHSHTSMVHSTSEQKLRKLKLFPLCLNKFYLLARAHRLKLGHPVESIEKLENSSNWIVFVFHFMNKLLSSTILLITVNSFFTTDKSTKEYYILRRNNFCWHCFGKIFRQQKTPKKTRRFRRRRTPNTTVCWAHSSSTLPNFFKRHV